MFRLNSQEFFTSSLIRRQCSLGKSLPFTGNWISPPRFSFEYPLSCFKKQSSFQLIHMRHDLRTGFQRKLLCKRLTGLTTERGTGSCCAQLMSWMTVCYVDIHGHQISYPNLHVTSWILPEDSSYVPVDNPEVLSSRHKYFFLGIRKKATVFDGPWSANLVLGPRLR